MNHNEITFSSIWPYIKIVTTWTGGSCGIALNRIKSSFPNEAVFFELGYLSSELRGTITINGTSNIGIPTFQYNFFEFVEKENWENNRHIFLTLNQIEINKEYYIFITTDSGLYRYHMNDIIKVTDFFENTPTFKFIQKGKGVVNITGEKLYESQVYNALNEVETNFKFNSTFYQMLGNEEERYYEIYLEADFNSSININELEIAIDTTLSKINLEYSSKRSGERLKPLKLFLLKKGTFENYKKHCLSKGQKESQFKTVALLPKKDFHYTFDEDIIN
jgi:hypothetical protein